VQSVTVTDEDSKPRFELSLACAIADGGTILAVPLPALAHGDVWADPQLLADVEAEAFAQVVVVHETGDAVYTYTFHLIERLNHQRVMLETAFLTNHIQSVHADYSEFCTPEISNE